MDPEVARGRTGLPSSSLELRPGRAVDKGGRRAEPALCDAPITDCETDAARREQPLGERCVSGSRA